MTGTVVAEVSILLTNIKIWFKAYGSLLLAPKDYERAGGREKREKQRNGARDKFWSSFCRLWLGQ